MRMKSDHCRRPLRFPRALDDTANNLLMPDVHAVEVAEGGDATAREIGLPQRIVKDQHRGEV